MVSPTKNIEYLDTPVKSESDPKNYRMIVLKNGLKALLVSDLTDINNEEGQGRTCNYDSSDSETCSAQTCSEDLDSEEDCANKEKLAACAVLIDVGSFAEPRKFPGLAHFLEHMIFMGSEKYPEENEFDAYIKKCGGFTNANTECEETLFYFEVSELYLDKGLDYFTALMKAPLMKKDAMTRERNAVESEFQQTLNNDDARRSQLLASLATPEYPQSAFIWGNLKSLQENVNDDELHATLHNFRKAHYNANRMIVCLQARMQLDEMEKIVLEHFIDVPTNTNTNNTRAESFSKLSHLNAFRPEFYNEVFFVKPVSDVTLIDFTWVMPPIIPLYRSKPNYLLGQIIGYEGEGSLCAYLRKRLWATKLYAGVDDSGFESNSIYSLFNLSIHLTTEGYEHLDEVITATFAYIKLLSDGNFLKTFFNEQKQIEDIAFKYQLQKPAFDNVQDLVTKVKHYPAKDILTSEEIYYEYDNDNVQMFLKHLLQFKFNIMITTGKQNTDSQADEIIWKQEAWFGTEYWHKAMPQRYIDMWQQTAVIPDLFLPRPNMFIPSDFRILWQELGCPNVPAMPKKLVQTDICKLWHRLDSKFKLPQAQINIKLLSPLNHMSAINDACVSCYVQLLKYFLAQKMYPAEIVGFNYSITTFDRGIILKIFGYNEKLPLLVDMITKHMSNITTLLTPEIFATIVQESKKTIHNKLIEPKVLNTDLRLWLTAKTYWPGIERYKCLNVISYEYMLNFCQQFIAELYVEALVQGNATEEMAHNMLNCVLTNLNCGVVKDTTRLINRAVVLPKGNTYLRCHGLNRNDCNTVISNYYQVGEYNLHMSCILDMIIMIIDEPLFDTLRTKEQLGYYVSARLLLTVNTMGFCFVINSQETKDSAKYVEERIEHFRASIRQIIVDLTNEDFEHIRNSLMQLKNVADMSLIEEIDRNWYEIMLEYYVFDRREKQTEILRTLTKQQLIEFLNNYEQNNFHKLSVQVIGNQPEPAESVSNAKLTQDEVIAQFKLIDNKEHDDDTTVVTDINEFKQRLETFPMHSIFQ